MSKTWLASTPDRSLQYPWMGWLDGPFGSPAFSLLPRISEQKASDRTFRSITRHWEAETVNLALSAV